MNIKDIYIKFELTGDKKSADHMQKFGIIANNAYGVKIPVLRQMAKDIGTNHQLAINLWEENCHEAKILATMVADPKQADGILMDKWVKDFYSWDICDQCIQNLFEKTNDAKLKAIEWANREPEFEKRAGYVMMARLALGNKKMIDKEFLSFFSYIIKGSTDERNFVKKAVNWAIRQIGKRSKYLNVKAIELAEKIKTINSKSARWIASDALRELTNQKVIGRIKK